MSPSSSKPGPMDPSSPIQFLSGVGPARATKLTKLGIFTVLDLLWHCPRSYMDRSKLTALADLEEDTKVTAIVQVEKVRSRRAQRGQTIVEVDLIDDRGGRGGAIWFNQAYLARSLVAGRRVLLHGKVARYRGSRLQFQAPEFELLDKVDPAQGELERGRATPAQRYPGRSGPATPPRPLHGGRVVPLYSLTAGITQKQIRVWVQTALEKCGDALVDVIPEAVRTRYGYPALRPCFERIHFPRSIPDAEEARVRLAFEEYLLLQLALGWLKYERAQNSVAPALPGTGELDTKLREDLPFALTQGQEGVLEDIRSDMALERPMSRLLQGDVGSGKTIVAALAAATALENDAQVAFMAPTEILALQQGESFSRWFAPLGRRVEVLIGRTGAADRRRILSGLATGSIDVVVGTHALQESKVGFRKLGLVVVDEQHRFGVMQRARLAEKGKAPHCLVMSATPIPRTLSLTLHGDLDLSLLMEKPPGRIPPKSYLVPPKKREGLLQFVADLARGGERAFFVYPLVEESEQTDLKDATSMKEQLSAHPAFVGVTIGLLHGRMKGEEKEEAIRRFREGETPCLVSTTVVEVGVDIPQATVMVVEHPERFGLSQLHQLRGRVGRGGGESHFFMMAPSNLAEETKARLDVMTKEDSGFAVAEADLRLRGPGSLLGTAQHGIPTLRVADLVSQEDVLLQAREVAGKILSADPRLDQSVNEGLRTAVLARHEESFSFLKIG